MLHDAIGIVGVSIVLLAYFLLQTEKVGARSVNYLLMNLIGSLGVLVSLSRNFNLASFAIETSWVLISVLGLTTLVYKRWRRSR